jgi:glycosyltransferase involved in cell wall biosynthesis
MREGWKVLRTSVALSKLLRTQGIDLVTSNGFRAHAYGGTAACLAGIPATWLTHTAEAPGVFTELMLRIPVRHVIANCVRTQRYFEARGLRTTLLYPTVDETRLAEFTPRPALGQRFGIPENGRWICMASRLQRYKGHEFFLRAIASLPAQHRDVHGIVIGGSLFGMEPDYPDYLKRLAAELGIGDRIHLTGFIGDDEVRGFVQASELLVHPALDEDFGMIVAEAQAMERAALAFASVGPAAIIIDGVTGNLVPVGDQAALDHALNALLSNPQQLKEFGAAGQARSLSLFGAARAARRLEEIYDSASDQ